MDKREKVMKGLECCCDVQSEWKDARYVCPVCPYTHNGIPCETLAPLMEDALALLKAQEPRVMTFDEVKSGWRNRDIAFLVEYNDGGYPVWMLYYGYLSTLGEILLIDEIAHIRHFGVDGYGVDWRCWTSRPTEEQKEAIPWK